MPPDRVRVREDANAIVVKERLLALVRDAEPTPRALVLSLADNHELDVETADMLAELTDALGREGVELRLAEVRAPVLEGPAPGGLAGRVRVDLTLESAVA